MQAIYGTDIIGDPQYVGLSYGGHLEATSYSQAAHPGVRAIRLGASGPFLLTANLDDPYQITLGDDLIGQVTPYAGASAPTGWLICDGAAISRTLYAALYAVIGDTYGPGDGSTTFHLPDLRQRFLAGAQAASAFDPGETGGATSHSHPLSADGYAKIQVSLAVGDNGVHMRRISTPSWNQNIKYTSATGASGASSAHTYGAELGGNTDSGGVNLPPYLAMHYIISTGTPTRVELWY